MREITEEDRWLMAAGRHRGLHEILGCHLDETGATFRLWAPGAAWAAVVGSFNNWNGNAHPLSSFGNGFWSTRVNGVFSGDSYKFQVTTSHYRSIDKADPFSVLMEKPPATASRAWDLTYEWGDGQWMKDRQEQLATDQPISIYEVHLGSWRNHGDVSYRNIAESLADYVVEQGFTHVEFLPLMEHPFYGSWGYQITGFFAPTARYGAPQDLMYLIDQLHQRGIGVILDWVPSHFPADQHGLAFFDGTHLYEHPDARRGFHPDWNSIIFDYDRGEVRSFLLSSAYSWLDRYHADGLRVDAVASMLYLDYSRQGGQWLPNEHGGREHLGAIELFRQLNGSVRHSHPGVATMAEESTSWPNVTGAPEHDSLGFHYKWDMGWMNDTLRYVRLDPLFRSHPDSHRLLTFRGLYAYSEDFLLPLSHDEVVHGKGSLFGKQWGGPDQKAAGLRTLLGYMWTVPGKKLLFMGGEFGQEREWDHDSSLDWSLLAEPRHRQILDWVRELNYLLRNEPALFREDEISSGFEWLEPEDYPRSVFAYLRRAEGSRPVLVLLNFTPVTWDRYQVGVPIGAAWSILLTSDDVRFGGAGSLGAEPLVALGRPHQDQPDSLVLNLPPLSATFLVPDQLSDGPAT
ncbi:MAG: 1,4-alpha-glucan branching protein GlgB [Acidimicrobiia bacterium]